MVLEYVRCLCILYTALGMLSKIRNVNQKVISGENME